ncbi:3610_t:CDS:2, partial [Diversispora eburnea]
SESSQIKIDKLDLKLVNKIIKLKKENIKIKAQVLLGEKLVVEYYLSFMEELELGAFFQLIEIFIL